MKITDGTGSGKAATVNEENQLRVAAVQVSEEQHANHHEGQAYNVMFDKSPTANDDCIFYMENNSDTLDIIVEGISLQIDGAGEVYLKLNAVGTRNAATALTPVNLNAKSGNAADGTFEHGVDLDGGAAGLSGGTETYRWVFAAANNSTDFNFEADIILGKANTITVWCSALARTIHGSLIFYFHRAA